MEKQTQIREKIESIGPNQYAFIDPGDIPFSKEVRAMCEMNSCGRYNTNWQCPPAVGEMEALEEKAKSYDRALMFNCVYPLEDSYDFEGMMAAKDNFAKTCLNALKAVSAYSRDCYAMGAGGCNICPQCTYPDAPCRLPDKAIASMEACGIDVYAASGTFGFQYINGVNTVTYFGIVFFR